MNLYLHTCTLSTDQFLNLCVKSKEAEGSSGCRKRKSSSGDVNAQGHRKKENYCQYWATGNSIH